MKLTQEEIDRVAEEIWRAGKDYCLGPEAAAEDTFADLREPYKGTARYEARAAIEAMNIEAAVLAERERCAARLDKRIEVIVDENGHWEPDTNHTNLPEWAETACEELEEMAAEIRKGVTDE